MRSGNDLMLDDIVQHDGRLWRIDDKQTILKITLIDIDGDRSWAPVSMSLEGDPEDVKFSPLNIQRLIPERVPGEDNDPR